MDDYNNYNGIDDNSNRQPDVLDTIQNIGDIADKINSRKNDSKDVDKINSSLDESKNYNKPENRQTSDKGSGLSTDKAPSNGVSSGATENAAKTGADVSSASSTAASGAGTTAAEGASTAAGAGAEAATAGASVEAATAGAAAEGAATAGGAGATAAGTAATGAGGIAAGAVLFWAALGLLIIFFLFMAIAGAFLPVDTYSTAYGVEPSTLMEEEYYNMDISTLAEEVSDSKVCEGQNIFDKFANWIKDLFADDIEDYCQFVRIVTRKAKKAKEETGVDVRRGLIISSILQAYTYVPDEEVFQLLYPDAPWVDYYLEEGEEPFEKRVDTIEPTLVLNNILSTNKESDYLLGSTGGSGSGGTIDVSYSVLKPEDIDLMIEYQIREMLYLSFDWGVVTTKATGESTRTCENTYINYWGCLPTTNSEYTFDINKYYLFLRYGWNSTKAYAKGVDPITKFDSTYFKYDYDSFDVAGYTELGDGNNLKKYYNEVGEGYEFDYMLNKAFDSSLFYCATNGEGEQPPIGDSTGECVVDNKVEGEDDTKANWVSKVHCDGLSWECAGAYFTNKLYDYRERRDTTLYTSVYADFQSAAAFVNPVYEKKLFSYIGDLDDNPISNVDCEETSNGFCKEKKVEFSYLEGYIFNKAPLYHSAMEADYSTFNPRPTNEYKYEEGKTEHGLEHIIYLIEDEYPEMEKLLGGTANSIDEDDPGNGGGIVDPGEYTDELNSDFNNLVVEIAIKYVNLKASIGDCSDFVSKVLNEAYQQMNLNMSVSDSSPSIYNSTKSRSVSAENLMPGDLVFWYSNSAGRIHHVAIYIGNGQIIETNTTSSARVSGSRSIPAITSLWCNRSQSCTNWSVVGYTRGY